MNVDRQNTVHDTELILLFGLYCACPQVGDQFNYGVFEHQMMLKGLAFVGIEDMGADKLKKVGKVWGGVGGWKWAC